LNINNTFAVNQQ